MSDETYREWRGVKRPDAVRLESFAELHRVEADGFAIEDDDIGFDGSGIDAKAGDGGNFTREKLRVCVIFVKALGRFLESDEAGCGDNAGLAHAAAKHFAIDAGLVDEFLRADNHGADGGAKAFREAEHDGIEIARHLRDGFTESDGGVEDARAVEMDLEVRGVSVSTDFVDLFCRIERAACHIMRVFEANERCL